ncbi:unnamed protein product [Leptosia nina]|uniref:Uncharacterized protein n=1 Tax=Leptosia nina TaxID=320188 RepID=A0AAV1JCF8_9NEOP
MPHVLWYHQRLHAIVMYAKLFIVCCVCAAASAAPGYLDGIGYAAPAIAAPAFTHAIAAPAITHTIAAAPAVAVAHAPVAVAAPVIAAAPFGHPWR